ncbi:MAG: 50S ribosomal protein L24 [Sumerlaeia bacterium]
MSLIRKGDPVIIISGGNKKKTEKRNHRVGIEGVVTRVFPEKDLVIVEGVNLSTHHNKVRPTEGGQEGGVEHIEQPVHISNVAYVDPETRQPVRLGITIKDGKKVRITKGRNSSKSIVD